MKSVMKTEEEIILWKYRLPEKRDTSYVFFLKPYKSCPAMECTGNFSLPVGAWQENSTMKTQDQNVWANISEYNPLFPLVTKEIIVNLIKWSKTRHCTWHE